MFDPRLFRVLDNQRRAFQGNLILIAVIAVFVISAGPANANPIPLGVASSYACRPQLFDSVSQIA